jgi:hypothetical protein
MAYANKQGCHTILCCSRRMRTSYQLKHCDQNKGFDNWSEQEASEDIRCVTAKVEAPRRTITPKVTGLLLL